MVEAEGHFESQNLLSAPLMSRVFITSSKDMALDYMNLCYLESSSSLCRTGHQYLLQFAALSRGHSGNLHRCTVGKVRHDCLVFCILLHYIVVEAPFEVEETGLL